ncbi:cell envelope integrity protein CreD [Pelagibius litoralis]|uniref:Cell envelope integrity protein CreD n=1 Tax=Pelagibius litoralis TaxID=374515 RepID=A0A967C570_9PROT|nr:cell envelope integrity protein CreD [Pelagibius litoralis]NIA68685.1 cell envelope integrity protein CreD [Pelagibius litoralis]
MQDGKTVSTFFSRYAALLKIGLLGLLVLIMTVPLEYVWSVVRERAYLSEAVERGLGESWGRAQTIAGPVLLLPIEEPRMVKVKAPDWTKEKPIYVDEQQWFRHHLYIMPETQNVTAGLTSQTRKRGIYEALLYTVAAQSQGQFRIPAAAALPVDRNARLLLDEARLLVHLSDLRGSANAPALQWGGTQLQFDVRSEALPGARDTKLSWIQAPLPRLTADSGALDFAFDVDLKGSERLRFVPLGRANDITLAGDWPHPSFAGVNLPITNQVGAEGFSAQWQVSHLARGLPQVLRANTPGSGGSGGANVLVQQIVEGGVETRLLNTVDFYSKSERSVKYGLLFVIVTFGTLFIFEALGRKRLHAVQYLMVGAAITLFFLLQLSLAEVIGFELAYGIAAFVCVALVTLYAAKITASWTRGLLLGSLLAAVYGYLFITLQSEDHAMLMGSFLLLALLAAAMYATRNFDWYALGSRLTPNAPAKTENPAPETAG